VGLKVQTIKTNSNHRKTMKTKITLLVCGVLLLAASLLNAADFGKAKPGSAEFEKMKSLVGTWQGKTDMGQGPMDLTVQYRLIAAGSVLEERIFPNTPHEMVTMYYDNKDGKLALTHYCVFGNRPAMTLKTADAKSLQFDFDQACGIDCGKESHMHALRISFDDADTITTSCKALIEGKETPEKPTTLKRVKGGTVSSK
jgi:hypothetical protein